MKTKNDRKKWPENVPLFSLELHFDRHFIVFWKRNFPLACRSFGRSVFYDPIGALVLVELNPEACNVKECKSQNKKLIEFLTRNDILSQLLDLILKVNDNLYKPH